MLGFFKLAKLVPTKRSVIVCFKMLSIKLYRSCVILYRILVIPLLPICEPPIMIKISLSPLKFYSFRETSNSLVEVALPIETYPLIIIRKSIAWVDLYRCGVVLYGPIELSDLIESETPVKQGLEVRGEDIEGLRVEGYSLKVIALLAGLVALRVVDLGLLLSLLMVWGEEGGGGTRGRLIAG